MTGLECNKTFQLVKGHLNLVKGFLNLVKGFLDLVKGFSKLGKRISLLYVLLCESKYIHVYLVIAFFYKRKLQALYTEASKC